MSRNRGDASRIALGAIGGGVLLGGIWYTATLRAENAMLQERVAHYESRAEKLDARSVPAREPKASVTSEPGDSRPQRMLSDEQRTAMRYQLSTTQGKKAWFEVQARDPEAGAFQREIEAVFRESGWVVAGISESGYRVKPGIYLFMADDEPAAHVSTALRGLEAAELDVFAGAGYRAYYEDRTAQDPSFRGHELAPGQEFVIVVGPMKLDAAKENQGERPR